MTEMLPLLLLLLHAAATFFMLGVIWFVQIVHYPLFAAVDREAFPTFHKRHTTLTTYVVMPVMLLEIATGLALFRLHLPAIEQWQLLAGALLLAVIWFSTTFLQVPCHNKLAGCFDLDVQRRLVATNWVRTLAWSLRAGLVTSMVWGVMG